MSLRESTLYKKALGCLVCGLVGDAVGTPSEGKSAADIESKLGWIEDFDSDGTDDTVMKYLLADALIGTDGYATFDDWGGVWMEQYNAIFGPKVGRFAQSVIHTAYKMRRQYIPRLVALGNIATSSSAMCISPVGIVNACNPEAAALQAYNLASLIHIHDVGFCQDGAAAMAAGVAEAFKPEATPSGIVEKAVSVIVPLSGKEMIDLIEERRETARSAGGYKAFVQALYDDPGKYFRPTASDSRETVPNTLALFELADGDIEKCVTYGANLGRDADTTASMAGALAGAYRGVEAIRKDWLEKALQISSRDQEQLAEDLVKVALSKVETERAAQERLLGIADG